MLCFQSVLYCIVLYNDVFTFLYVAVGNKLLLLLLRNALAEFKTQLSGLTVQLMSDSTTVVSYIAKQGGHPPYQCIC